MNKRIRDVRKRLNLTQVELGEKIGVKGNTVAQYESGRNMPPEVVITSICREFNVNEKWLRTGEGGPEAMFNSSSRKDEIWAFAGHLINGSDDFKTALVSVLARMSIEEWDVLEQIARRLLEETKRTAE